MKRVVSLALCLSLLIGTVAIKPQKTDAVILETASVIAAVAVIMTACGVTYWANSQTEAINYLGGKIDAYLQTLEEPPATYEDWLDLHDGGAIFEVLNGGIMRFGTAVANKMLDFVRWFTATEEIDSGGEEITVSLGGFEGQPLYKTSTNITAIERFNLSYVATSELEYPSYGYRYVVAVDDINTGDVYCATYGTNNINILVLSNDNITGWVYLGNGNNIVNNGSRRISSSTLTYAGNTYKHDIISTSNTFTTIRYNHYETYEKALAALADAVENGVTDVRITPSDNVTIPNIDEYDAIDILPSVALSTGSTVETASDVILQGVTSAQGLTSTIEEQASGGDGSLTGVLEILQDIYDFVVGIPQAVYGLFRDVLERIDIATQDIVLGVQQLPTTIRGALQDAFVPSQSEVQSFVASIEAAFANRLGLLTYPLAAVEGFVQRFTTEDWGSPVFTWGDIKEPFSGQILIQAGTYNLADTLNSDPMRRLYDVYLVVVKAWLCGAFLELCRRKYNKVISDGGSA